MRNTRHVEQQSAEIRMVEAGKRPTPLQLHPSISTDLELFRRDRDCSPIADMVRAHLHIAPQS